MEYSGCRGEAKKRAIQEEWEENEEEEAKRSCIISDVDEFFALLQRIRETVWRLSFDWEDFDGVGNGTRDVKPSPPSKAQVLNLNSKQGVKRQSICLDEKSNGDTEMPDLNLPSTPPVLQLFY
ncbi:hypothetical protein SUGI_0104800 [Cryptomeria japonica]|nr:hypothetical protein SUGI_0104800 [Cryptomeria japonica]